MGEVDWSFVKDASLFITAVPDLMIPEAMLEVWTKPLNFGQTVLYAAFPVDRTVNEPAPAQFPSYKEYVPGLLGILSVAI